MGAPKYYLVDSAVLPEVYVKVVEAKRMLSQGMCRTVGEATRCTGVSRSVFYKYKDMVFPFEDMKSGRMLTLYGLLRDEQGVLSALLGIIAAAGANVLTINQNIPVNGLAHLSLSVHTGAMGNSVEQLLEDMRALPGIVEFNFVATE